MFPPSIRFSFDLVEQQGRYLPVFASEIVDQNTIAASQGQPTINLKSVLIGNGVTDISTYVLFLLAHGSSNPWELHAACTLDDTKLNVALPT